MVRTDSTLVDLSFRAFSPQRPAFDPGTGLGVGLHPCGRFGALCWHVGDRFAYRRGPGQALCGNVRRRSFTTNLSLTGKWRIATSDTDLGHVATIETDTY